MTLPQKKKKEKEKKKRKHDLTLPGKTQGRVTLCNISSRSPQTTILAKHQIIMPAVPYPAVNLKPLF